MVPGGGVALVRCIQALENVKVTGEEKNGIAILKRALMEPLRQIVQNAASVSGLMLTTEAMIAEKPEKKKVPAMPPGVMGEDMY